MKITLTKVSYSAALSDETPAFSATVCIDGIPAYATSNQGTGGSDQILPLKGQTYADAFAMQKKVDAYAKTLPPVIELTLRAANGEPLSYPQSAESLVGDALQEWQRQKQGRRILAKLKDRVVMIDGSRLSTSNKAPAGRLPEWIEYFRKKHPDAIILNCLTPEAASEIIFNEVLT